MQVEVAGEMRRIKRCLNVALDNLPPKYHPETIRHMGVVEPNLIECRLVLEKETRI